MFNELSIATTAISSFNNAALFGAYFLGVALVCFPLFWAAYVYGHDFMARIGWTNRDLKAKLGFWSVACMVLWLMLFGGNYAVIRDGISLLPSVVAFVIFISTIFVTNYAKHLKYVSKIPNKKTGWILFFVLMMLAACSASPSWWGVLLQTSAVFCGIVVGSRIKKELPVIPVTTIIFTVMTVLVLMQPEYFRFGQLGNLTVLHLLGLVLTGFFAVTTLTTRYVHARGKIYESAYVKLNWFFRIVSLLTLILFFATESVPVFIGLMLAVFFGQSLIIYHSKQSMTSISERAWALLLFMFGCIIVCPVISVLGVLYFAEFSDKAKLKDFARLL